MNTKELNKRIEKATEKYKNEYKARIQSYIKDANRAKTSEDRQWHLDRIKEFKNKIENPKPFQLQFRKKRQVFVNSRETCMIDLINEHGHSYRWWTMLKRINGVLCLNTYRYSAQTSIHINKASNVLNKLSVKYVEIEAPQGLQNLESAVNYAANEMGKAIVREKYARKKSRYILKYAQSLIKNLEKIGVKVTQKMINQGIENAETDRANRLERQRNVIRFKYDSPMGAKGLHHVSDSRYLSYSEKSELIEQAKTKGYKVVHIHIKDQYQTEFQNKVLETVSK